MGATKEFPIAADDLSKASFDAFNDHCSGRRIDTDVTTTEVIRKANPGYHVTATSADNCSLLEYASAGKATFTLEGDDETYIGKRAWEAVGEGVDKQEHPGKLDNKLRYARYSYAWEGKTFIVYEAQWRDPFKSPKHIFYVLYPRTEGTISNGHCAETDALLLVAGKWTSELHEEIFVFDNAYWSKSKELWNAVQGSSWDDVILDPDMKKQIMEDVLGFFDSKQLYRDFAVPWKRGVIFHGVPGNGKTISLKALINSLQERPVPIPSLYVKSFQACQGEQYAVQQIFKGARKSAPCLLIFEDLDSLLVDKVRSYFLNEVDGLESNDGILMIGSTNHLDRLDPAIAKRPSRFDRKYHYKIPKEAERTAYSAYWRKKLQKNKSIDFPAELDPIISKLTESFSFAYLKELFVMALLTVARGGQINEEDIPETVEAVEEEKKEVNGETTANGEVKSEATTNGEVSKQTNGEAAKEEEKPKKPVIKRTVPEVEVPEHLKDNVLLKVIQHQIRILISEMDNTDEDDWPSGRVKGQDCQMA